MNKPIVFITGASRGLGKALATKLSENHIVYSGVRNLSDAPPNTLPIHLDLTREDSMQEAINHIIQNHHHIDTLIHNAGICYVGPVDSMTPEEAHHQFQVNFFGPLRLTQLALPHMRKRKSGHILFISSDKAIDSGPYIGLYSASKAALEATATDWATSLTPWNITVSIFQPGPINTNIPFHQGTYFTENPYPPLKNFTLQTQSTEEVCNAILKHLSSSTFKSQSSPSVTKTLKTHLTDPSGNTLLSSQKAWFQSHTE